MSRKSPKHARKTVRRGAVAAGAIAATAAMTIAVPTGAANAAPTRNPQIDGLLAAAPYAPGLLTSAGILAVAPRITQLTDAYAENVPVLPGLFPVSNSARPIVSAAGLLPYTHTPNWTGVGAENVFSAGAPFGLGGVTNTTYGMTGIYSQLVSIPGPLPLPPIAIPAGTGSTAGNVTAITGPLGSALNLQSSLTSVVGLDGNTTWTPALGLGGTFPLGLGTARRRSCRSPSPTVRTRSSSACR
ncbi:hypothetical protein [Tsukamurella sp. PLM1]|uniref:hypothetical protein n=1 Tax=Tsukamurella sp. PLM1 TaxID=2929795 RepID=UPI00206F7342|nr:hypothetical protein [Tsukamurella sp. PLM1]BDH57170.1 hypothetical protein MTP03_21090 [Tsukamurella sp. PLM1]